MIMPGSSASWSRPINPSPGPARAGEDELDRQTRAVYSMKDAVIEKFQKRIAFNLIPQIDVFMEDGYTKEEWKMMVETKKILDPKIRLTATCVRVPVFVSHSEAVKRGIREIPSRRTRPAISCAARRGSW